MPSGTSGAQRIRRRVDLLRSQAEEIIRWHWAYFHEVPILKSKARSLDVLLADAEWTDRKCARMERRLRSPTRAATMGLQPASRADIPSGLRLLKWCESLPEDRRLAFATPLPEVQEALKGCVSALAKPESRQAVGKKLQLLRKAIDRRIEDGVTVEPFRRPEIAEGLNLLLRERPDLLYGVVGGKRKWPEGIGEDVREHVRGWREWYPERASRHFRRGQKRVWQHAKREVIDALRRATNTLIASIPGGEKELGGRLLAIADGFHPINEHRGVSAESFLFGTREWRRRRRLFRIAANHVRRPKDRYSVTQAVVLTLAVSFGT